MWPVVMTYQQTLTHTHSHTRGRTRCICQGLSFDNYECKSGALKGSKSCKCVACIT